MAMMPPAAVARSNAYFEGGYWLILWDFLYGIAISLLLLNLRWSARMRDLAVRVTRYRWLQPLPYAVLYTIAVTVLGFPLEFYENYVREHKYGLATQTFGPWMGDEVKSLLVSLVIASIGMLILFAIVRKFPNTWWIWGAAASIGLMTILIAIGPVYLQPIFNKPRTQRPQDHDAHPEHGARQRNSHQRCVPDRRQPPDHAHERQRQRIWQHHAHHPQ